MYSRYDFPSIGVWYKTEEYNEIFEVVALDQKEDFIEIQFFNGEIEEIDFETWNDLHTTEVAEPEDWRGPYEMLKEDMFEYFDETIRPEDWNNPLTYIESNRYQE